MSWRDISGYEGRYQVSAAGEVRNVRSGRVLKLTTFSNGYLGVKLGRASRMHLVHRLVAVAFVPGDVLLQVNHRNGRRTDNRADNLEWVTCSENHQHSYRELPRKPHALRRTVQIIGEGGRRVFQSGVAAARFLRVSPGSVASAAQNNHKCKGYEVRYV